VSRALSPTSTSRSVTGLPLWQVALAGAGVVLTMDGRMRAGVLLGLGALVGIAVGR
jgi:hypothetical protein